MRAVLNFFIFDIRQFFSIKSKDLPLADRVKRLEDQGLLKSAAKESAKKIPPSIPLPDGIAQKYLQQDRDDE